MCATRQRASSADIIQQKINMSASRVHAARHAKESNADRMAAEAYADNVSPAKHVIRTVSASKVMPALRIVLASNVVPTGAVGNAVSVIQEQHVPKAYASTLTTVHQAAAGKRAVQMGVESHAALVKATKYANQACAKTLTVLLRASIRTVETMDVEDHVARVILHRFVTVKAIVSFRVAGHAEALLSKENA